jgi:hypothetical protein
MQYMNDYDIEYARRRFTRSSTPNRLALAMVVDNLREWTNLHSDGWAYWPKPCRAADKAMTLINSTTNAANDEQERHDITEAEMLAAVKPIKAFLTRQGSLVSAEAREIILRSVTS